MFTAANSQSIEFKSSRSERPNPYTIGQQVAVRYLPEDPTARIWSPSAPDGCRSSSSS
jgi:hypothetical protein